MGLRMFVVCFSEMALAGYSHQLGRSSPERVAKSEAIWTLHCPDAADALTAMGERTSICARVRAVREDLREESGGQAGGRESSLPAYAATLGDQEAGSDWKESCPVTTVATVRCDGAAALLVEGEWVHVGHAALALRMAALRALNSPTISRACMGELGEVPL